jgi:hypothetical protein
MKDCLDAIGNIYKGGCNEAARPGSDAKAPPLPAPPRRGKPKHERFFPIGFIHASAT